MTIRDELLAALPPVTRSLLDELGAPCALRRPEEDPTPAADNSATVEWMPLRPFESRVVLQALPERQRRELWGTESRARLLGVADLAIGLATGDILRPLDGSYAGQAFEIVERTPIDEGGVAMLGLTAIPDRTEHGW